MLEAGVVGFRLLYCCCCCCCCCGGVALVALVVFGDLLFNGLLFNELVFSVGGGDAKELNGGDVMGLFPPVVFVVVLVVLVVDVVPFAFLPFPASDRPPPCPNEKEENSGEEIGLNRVGIVGLDFD